MLITHRKSVAYFQEANTTNAAATLAELTVFILYNVQENADEILRNSQVKGS